MRRERPDVFIGYTVKPNVYGSMAANHLGIPVINNITGLGAAFIKESFLTRIVRKLYRVSLRNSRKVFFQNQDDRRYFIESGLSTPDVADLLPGSGIDLEHFSSRAIPSSTDEEQEQFRFLLIARMLWDKGVGEFIEAARQLRKKYPHVEFCLLGFLDVQNPTAISREQIQAWVEEGIVNYLGVTDDVRPEIDNADCIVLPSYREGTPRTLLEAAAMAKPIIATDAVGCREVVDHETNGFLCKLCDADDLAEKMEQMLEMPNEARREMGRHGRARVEQRFDEQFVIRKHQDAIDEILYPVP
jgi:glycosyltransferase involved in cell wall biosynthesis